MIRPEQLADALQRLEPRDRELLSLSLHRRVPDEALALMYDYEPAEVSRRRAAAIERLADDLRVQRGEDLGSVLKALLEPGTWSGIEPAPGREFAVPDGGRRPGAPAGPERARAERAEGSDRERRRTPSPPPRRSPRGPAAAARAPAGAGAAPARAPARRRSPRRSPSRHPPRSRRWRTRRPIATARRAGARHARRGPQGRRGIRTPRSHRRPHARRPGRRRARRRGRPDGRHAARRRRLGRRPDARRRRRHAQLRAGEGRSARGAVRLGPAAPRPATRPPTCSSRPSCSASRAASRGCGSRSAPSGGRRACSASSASAATGSGCRPRS